MSGSKRLHRALALAALAVSVGMLTSCGGASALESPTLEKLSQAATTSAEAPSGRFELAVDVTYPGMPIRLALTGEGAFDTKAEQASLSFDLSSLAGLLGGLIGNVDALEIRAIQDGDDVYLSSPQIADQLSPGKSWLRVDGATVPRTQGGDFSELRQFATDHRRTLLELLEAVAGDLETVGAEELRGVTTTHYRAEVDLRNADGLVPPFGRDRLRELLDDLVERAGLSEIPIDVWLDDSGYVRKLQLSLSAGTTDVVEASTTLELYDYGADVGITPPAADEVVDLPALSG